MNIKFCTAALICCLLAFPAFAIDPVYEGENGIRENVFATNCLFCHSSNLSGAERNGAPPSVNWDTYKATMENAPRAIVRAVQLMTMPPFFSGLPTLNDEQKAAMLAWEAADFPRYPTEAVYSFETQRLTLPVVNVGVLFFRATLQLIPIVGSPLGFGFVLESAELTTDSSATAATFIPQTGEVEIPEVMIAGGNFASDKVSASMQLLEGTSPFQFTVTNITFIFE